MVQVEGLERLLREHPFFQEFGADDLALLAGCAANERFEAGQSIIREGDSADRFYIVRHGTVAVEMGVPAKGRLTIQTLGDGEILGWSWLVPPYKWAFDARAVTLSRLISLDAKCLRTKLEANYELGYRLLQRFIPVMAGRLTASRLQMLDLYGPPGAARKSP